MFIKYFLNFEKKKIYFLKIFVLINCFNIDILGTIRTTYSYSRLGMYFYSIFLFPFIL